MQIKGLQDNELVHLYEQGLNEAFDVLQLRYKDRLFAYINRVVNNKILTEDIYQETLIKVILSIKGGHYVETGKFYSWLVCVAHNLLIDFYRKKQKLFIKSYADFDFDCLCDQDCGESSVECFISQSQMEKQLSLLIEQLPKNQKEVILMRFYQDLSFKEIADLTGVSINTALGRLRYGVINMRKMLCSSNVERTKFSLSA